MLEAEGKDFRHLALGIVVLEFYRDIVGGVTTPPPEPRRSSRG